MDRQQTTYVPLQSFIVLKLDQCWAVSGHFSKRADSELSAWTSYTRDLTEINEFLLELAPMLSSDLFPFDADAGNVERLSRSIANTNFKVRVAGL